MKDVVQKYRDLTRLKRVRNDHVVSFNAFAEAESVHDPGVVLTLHFEAKPSVNIEFHFQEAHL